VTLAGGSLKTTATTLTLAKRRAPALGLGRHGEYRLRHDPDASGTISALDR
jgi:hypothetical protein